MTDETGTIKRESGPSGSTAQPPKARRRTEEDLPRMQKAPGELLTPEEKKVRKTRGAN
jgi:hypothetical protein